MKLREGEFYGQTAQTLGASGFRFTEKHYKTDAELPAHSHELSHFCFVLDGLYAERIGSRSYERAPTALVFYPPDVNHAEKHGSAGRHFLVEIDAQNLERVRDYGARLTDPVLLADDAALWLASRMYREFRDVDEFSGLVLESSCFELLVNASRSRRPTSERRPPKWLVRVKEYVCDNFVEPPGLSELARAAGVHPTHLARSFRRFENCTIGDYVRRIRIEKAKQLMMSTKASLAEIALAAGFADQTHFTRSFKRSTGMTPAGFRSIFKPR